VEESALEFKKLIKILKRRKWDVLLPTLVIFLIVAIAVLSWPPTYRSTSTILIEEQEIPKEYVTVKVKGYAEQRLQSISQRIMRYDRLLEIINRFQLYADLRRKSSMEKVVDQMRKKDIKFKIVSANILDRNRPNAAAITFTCSYEGEKPEVVQQVTKTLASLYLEGNGKGQEEKSAEGAKFTENEENKIKKDLAALDAKIAALKSINPDFFPVDQLNTPTRDRNEQEIKQLNDRLRTLKEKESDLQNQLAGTSPGLGNTDRERLKELLRTYVKLRLHSSEVHPDMTEVKQEISDLERQLESSRGPDSLGGVADNPAYMALSAQLAGTRSDINSIQRQISLAQSRLDGYRNRTESGPRTEEQYKLLLSERNNLKSKYDNLIKKHMEARIVRGLEKVQMVERFTLIDPARLPEKPIRPNIPAVLLIGLILGAGVGVGTASLREYNDSSIHSVDELEMVTRRNVFLAVIPEIDTRKDNTESLKPDSAILAMERVRLADAGENIDWAPPSYSQSRSVHLNPEVMKRNRCVAMFSNLEKVEPYRGLRRLILNRTQETGGNLIMVTSALPGEGKTLTAINLAFTLAREFMHTVLLVDCDLKKQSIHKVFGFDSDKGLLDYLLGECPASDLFVWPVVEKLSLISGGKTINESSKIIASPLMKDLVDDIKNRYPERYIIFDVPPILSDVDALNLAPLVDYVLMVVQADKTSLVEVNKAVQFIPKDKLLGFVLNRYRP